MNLVAHLAKKLQLQNNSAPKKIIVAYSGGVDSHALLHVMAGLRREFDFSLAACHIHHGLSENADDWQLHCQRVCAELDVTFESAKVTVHKTKRQSLEALARKQRYLKLSEMAPSNSIILLAQHQDDQLETVLLQLKRGAGPKGLAGMAERWSETSREGLCIEYMRPILDVTQEQILAYAQTHNLAWQEDESNKNIDFERNFLRQDVLPILTERWPELAHSVSRSARLCAQQQELLDEISQQKLLELRLANNSLDIQKLCGLSDIWQLQVVRAWLAAQQIQSPSEAVLKQLKTELFAASDDANPIIRWQNWQFRRFEQKLYVVPLSADLSGQTFPLSGQGRMKLPQGLGELIFDTSPNIPSQQDISYCVLDRRGGDFSLRFGGYGDRFKPAGQAHSKALKQWFKLWKIPPWERSKIGIIVQNDQVKALVLAGKILPAYDALPDAQLPVTSQLNMICISISV